MASKKVALIIHGWPCHDISHHFLVEYLKKKGYEVFAPDLFITKSKFVPDQLHDLVIKILHHKKPKLIVGISIGGIIMPYIAKDFPKAKLIFVATGPSLKPDLQTLKILLKAAKNKFFIKTASKFIKLPDKILQSLYIFVNPKDFLKADKNRKVELISNLRSIKEIPQSKETEIINFAAKADSSSILSELSNESLIFSGLNDTLMPVKAGKKLKKLLKHSKLIINKGQHYNVLTYKELDEIEGFLYLTS